MMRMVPVRRWVMLVMGHRVVSMSWALATTFHRGSHAAGGDMVVSIAALHQCGSPASAVKGKRCVRVVQVGSVQQDGGALTTMVSSDT